MEKLSKILIAALVFVGLAVAIIGEAIPRYMIFKHQNRQQISLQTSFEAGQEFTGKQLKEILETCGAEPHAGVPEDARIKIVSDPERYELVNFHTTEVTGLLKCAKAEAMYKLLESGADFFYVSDIDRQRYHAVANPLTGESVVMEGYKYRVTGYGLKGGEYE